MPLVLLNGVMVELPSIEISNDEGNPVPTVDAGLTEQFSSDFSRLLEKRFKDSEEVRYDIPPTAALPNNSIYLGVAPDPSLTSDLVWSVVRIYFNANSLPNRARIRKNISWDERTIGW